MDGRDMKQTVAFVGLGNMGLPMAKNLLKAGYAVRGVDVSETARNLAAKAGIATTTSLLEAVRDGTVVITMLISGEIVRSVHAAVATAARPGTLVIDCSTIDVEDAWSTHANLTRLGFRSVDAPVSGGIAAAAAATLTFMCGGETAVIEAARPLLEAMGKRIITCGPPGSGQAAKISNDLILGVSMIAVCETTRWPTGLASIARRFSMWSRILRDRAGR